MGCYGGHHGYPKEVLKFQLFRKRLVKMFVFVTYQRLTLSALYLHIMSREGKIKKARNISLLISFIMLLK